MISLCMIVKDEEQHLENCLNSIKELADEIIIVDTGSKDKTKEIAGKFTNKVYDFKWNDDFSEARNFSLSKATKDWILVLDADENRDRGLTLPQGTLILRLSSATKDRINRNELAAFLVQPNRLLPYILDLTSGSVRRVTLQGREFLALDLSA